MRRPKICGEAAIALWLALVGICSAPQATAQQPTNEVRKAMVWKRYQYVCDGNAKVTVYLRDELAKVRYEDKQYLMKQTVSADGNRYSDGKVVWWGKGHGGFLQEDKPDGNGEMIVTECRLGEEPSAQPAAAGVLSGTVTYLQRVALPSSAVVNVKLLDVSRADAAATVIAEQKITTGGRQVPIAFELKFDAAKMDPKHRYTVSARITVDGVLRFVSDQAYPLATPGSPTTGLEILLQAVPAN
jgi:putative lipoprotein